jgi:Anti-sigma-K factor rskA
MTRPPDFDDLVGGEVEGAERERLRRVHDLLVAAGPPPELPPSLVAPEEGGTVVPFRGPSRRRLAVAAILAAAVAAAAFGIGFFAGGEGDEESAADPTYVVELSDGDEGRASLAVYDADEAGNWPMRMTVQGLEDGETYELWLTRDGRLVRLCGTFAAGADRTVVELNAPWELSRFDGWVVTRAGTERPVLTQAAAS